MKSVQKQEVHQWQFRAIINPSSSDDQDLQLWHQLNLYKSIRKQHPIPTTRLSRLVCKMSQRNKVFRIQRHKYRIQVGIISCWRHFFLLAQQSLLVLQQAQLYLAPNLQLQNADYYQGISCHQECTYENDAGKHQVSIVILMQQRLFILLVVCWVSSSASSDHTTNSEEKYISTPL